MRRVEFNVEVREEDAAYWAEVTALRGCFASGATLDELNDALAEAIGMYLDDGEGTPTAHAEEVRIRVS